MYFIQSLQFFIRIHVSYPKLHNLECQRLTMTLAAAVPIKTNRLQSTVGKKDMKNMAEEAQNLLKHS